MRDKQCYIDKLHQRARERRILASATVLQQIQKVNLYNPFTLGRFVNEICLKVYIHIYLLSHIQHLLGIKITLQSRLKKSFHIYPGREFIGLYEESFNYTHIDKHTHTHTHTGAHKDTQTQTGKLKKNPPFWNKCTRKIL